jgi:hypothetical protein
MSSQTSVATMPMQNLYASHAKLGRNWGERVRKFEGLDVWFLSP